MQNEKIKPNRFLTTIKKKMLVSILCLASLSGIAVNVHEHNEISQLTQHQEQLGINSENTLISVKVYYKGKLITNHTIAMTPDENASSNSFDNTKNNDYINSILTDKDGKKLKQFSSFETGERLSIDTRKITDDTLSINLNFSSTELNDLTKFKESGNTYIELPNTNHLQLSNSLFLKKGKTTKLEGTLAGNNEYEIDLSVM
jgi:hypothetical protein